MEEEKTRDQNKFIVRMPDGMRDRIAAEAKANNRSMNAEIVARLEMTLETNITSTERLDELLHWMARSSAEHAVEEFAKRAGITMEPKHRKEPEGTK